MRRLLLAICLLILCWAPLGAQPSITTKTIADGSLGHIYHQELLCVAAPPSQWSVAPGSQGLPPGLHLSTGPNSLGVIDGLPTTPGDYSFTLQIRDSTGGTAQKAFSITIAAITVLGYIPTAVFMTPYSGQLAAIGGSGGPY